MAGRFFKGPLNSNKNIKAFIDNVKTYFGDSDVPQGGGESPIIYGDWIINPDVVFEPECPEYPCEGCDTPTPTPTLSSTPTPTPPVPTPSTTPITPTPTPPVPTPTPSSSYDFGPLSFTLHGLLP